MSEIVYLDQVSKFTNSVVTVGTFDGVHAGHRTLIRKVVERAEKQSLQSIIVTFDPHPRDILSPDKREVQLLTTLEERYEILAELGIDEMVVIPFDRNFSLMKSVDFVQNIIWEKIGVKEFVIGFDHQFGKDREGSITTIKDLGIKLGFDVYVVTKQEIDNRKVSSTIIRKALVQDGNVVLAADFLCRPYQLTGTVIRGDGRGKKIGFPTANIEPSHPNKIIPKNGVYAVNVTIQGHIYTGMMNIGIRPTFGNGNQTLEIHLFDFEQDIYGYHVKVNFIKRIRDEVQFNSVDELRTQLKNDREVCLKLL